MADILTSAIHIKGTVPIPYGDTVSITKVPRRPGQLYWDYEDQSLWVWDGYAGAWVPTASAGVGRLTIHDDPLKTPTETLSGKGVAGDALYIRSPIWEYDPGKIDYETGNCVSMLNVPGYRNGIYRLDDSSVVVWKRYDPIQLRINISRTFNAGDYFYVNGLSVPYDQYNGIYLTNSSSVAILITPTDVTELQAHIANGDITWLTETPGGSMSYWRPAPMAYVVGDMVYRKVNDDPTLGSNYSVFYECIVALPLGQATFSITDDINNWTLLADLVYWEEVGGVVLVPGVDPDVITNPTPKDRRYLYVTLGDNKAYYYNGTGYAELNNELPIGIMVGYSEALATLPDANWLRCDGSMQQKTAYPDLYTKIGTIFGPETTTSFQLPLVSNMIIRVRG